MVGLIQRVQSASVMVGQQQVATIGMGLLVFIGIQRDDDPDTARRLVQRSMALRLFPQYDGRMGLNLLQAGGDLLLVPQFTLAARIKGTRPDFGPAAPPQEASALFDTMMTIAQTLYPAGKVAAGVFGAHMMVHLVNDGPVTFHLEEPSQMTAAHRPGKNSG
jgi:D-tyrosyl-tRNA(Tyr) deacylase